MSIPFHPSPSPTLGVEVELQLIDPATRQLIPRAPELLVALENDPHVKPELLQSTIELNTGICADVPAVRCDLEATLARVHAACDELGIALISAGTHPFSTWPGQKITDKERYRALIDRVQWPAKRLMIFGLHVHVGMDSAEKSVAVFNALAGYIPQFLALSASSPFWQGNDTGLASVRSKVFETLPTAGLPETLLNWGEFQSFMNTLITAGAIESIREVWWDIRPHPGFGTVELRVCDGLPTLDELLAVVAFTHCVTVWLAREYEEGHLQLLERHWVTSENKWRAARWGLEAQLILDDQGTQIRNGDRIAGMLEKLAPLSLELNCSNELTLVQDILDRGPSCLRQRQIFGQTGRLEPVVDALVQEWRANKRIDSV